MPIFFDLIILKLAVIKMLECVGGTLLDVH